MPFCGVAGWSRSWFQHMWSPHRDLNSGPHSYQECALPLSYVGSALSGSNFVPVSCLVQGVGFEPTKHKAADLQSAGFDRSPIPAQPFILTQLRFQSCQVTNFVSVDTVDSSALKSVVWSPRGDSNPPTCQLQIGCAAIAPLGQEVMQVGGDLLFDVKSVDTSVQSHRVRSDPSLL